MILKRPPTTSTSERVIAQQRHRRRSAEIRDADMETEAGADVAYYEVEIKMEPVDEETDYKETQQVDCDAEVKEEEAAEANAGCGVKDETTEKLYTDHIIKQEVAIGPVVLQRCLLLSDADTSKECSNTSNKSKADKNPLYLRVCEYSRTAETLPQSEDLATKFTTKSVRTRYKQITQEKPFCCSICKKHFAQKSNLTRHEQIHTGEKPYSCIVCEKQFTQKSNLTQHEQVHTGKRPFCCVICEKQFTWKADLVRHERIHNGEKPFRCKICKKQFSQKNNLTQHEQIHTKEKPFCCKICRKHFTQKSTLTRHEQIHTKGNPFSCKICEKQFTQKSNLNKHEQTHAEIRNIVVEKFVKNSLYRRVNHPI